MPWLALGTTSSSKSLPALISASTSRIVDSGGTFVSISPTINSSLPCSRWALSMLETRGIPRADRVAHPLLVPRGLVHAIVVAAAGRGRDLVELGMEQHAGRRVLAARRRAVDPHPAEVVPRVLLGDGLVPEDAVREAGVLDVVPADVVKRLGPVGRPHAVDLDHDETRGPSATRNRLHRAEGLGDERALRDRRRSARSPGISCWDRSPWAGR